MSGNPPHSLVERAVAEAMAAKAASCPPGDFLEVGVFCGGTAWHLARVADAQHRTLYLADTFDGIPYAIEGLDSHKAGDFRCPESRLETVMENLSAFTSPVYVPGIFPGSILDLTPTLAFVHLDCDQYQSYTDALAWLRLRMAPGGVVWCDDVGCLDSAGRAVEEFTRAQNLPLVRAEKPYIQF